MWPKMGRMNCLIFINYLLRLRWWNRSKSKRRQKSEANMRHSSTLIELIASKVFDCRCDADSICTRNSLSLWFCSCEFVKSRSDYFACCRRSLNSSNLIQIARFPAAIDLFFGVHCPAKRRNSSSGPFDEFIAHFNSSVLHSEQSNETSRHTLNASASASESSSSSSCSDGVTFPLEIRIRIIRSRNNYIETDAQTYARIIRISPMITVAMPKTNPNSMHFSIFLRCALRWLGYIVRIEVKTKKRIFRNENEKNAKRTSTRHRHSHHILAERQTWMLWLL